jgi:hypothetical protein
VPVPVDAAAQVAREARMRFLGTCVLVGLLASPQSVAAQVVDGAATSKQASAGLVVHAHIPLPPQLMLRSSYFLYLDTDADTDAASDQTEPNAQEPKSGQAAEEGAIPPEEPVSSPAPGTEVPDLETLSHRSIEHYESQSAKSGKKGGTGKRSRGAKAGIAVGVIVGVGLVGFGIGAAVAVSNMEF